MAFRRQAVEFHNPPEIVFYLGEEPADLASIMDWTFDLPNWHPNGQPRRQSTWGA